MTTYFRPLALQLSGSFSISLKYNQIEIYLYKCKKSTVALRSFLNDSVLDFTKAATVTLTVSHCKHV